MIITDEASCLHHWIIESPNGLWSLATCKKCKKVDAFKNSLDEPLWSPPIKSLPPNVKSRAIKNKDKDMITKEEFLTQMDPQPIKSNGSKYETEFKLKIVQETNIYGRTKVRKKYGLPETTLRGWIKRYT